MYVNTIPRSRVVVFVGASCLVILMLIYSHQNFRETVSRKTLLAVERIQETEHKEYDGRNRIEATDNGAEIEFGQRAVLHSNGAVLNVKSEETNNGAEIKFGSRAELHSNGAVLNVKREETDNGGEIKLGSKAELHSNGAMLNVRREDTYGRSQLALGNKMDTGQPDLDELRANSVSFDLASYDIDEMSDKQVELTFHSYLDNTNTVCNRSLRMGNIEDGGWEVCDDKRVRPEPPCLVYSFGIHNDWSFDDDVSRLYRCHVFSFDPSMKIGHYNRSDLVHFYQWGISGTTYINDDKWQLYTLADIRDRLGHSSTKVDILKMDIENSEWSTLRSMIRTQQFADIRQLLIEFHVFKSSPTKANLKHIQEIEKAGFRKFNVHKNFHCPKRIKGFPVTRTACYEVHYIKVK